MDQFDEFGELIRQLEDAPLRREVATFIAHRFRKLEADVCSRDPNCADRILDAIDDVSAAIVRGFDSHNLVNLNRSE